MSVIIHSAVTSGLQVIPLTIEAALGSGFAGVQLLGLPLDYARDAKERIRAALESLGLTLPARRLIVSVRPSEWLKPFKSGLEHLDLPCAVAVLAALAELQNPPKLKSAQLRLKNILPVLQQARHLFAGQLTLSGDVLPLEQSLPFELLALQSQHEKALFWFQPHPDKPLSFPSPALLRVSSLEQCLVHLLENTLPLSTPCVDAASQHSSAEGNFTLPASPSTDTLRQRMARIEATLRKFESFPALALALCTAAAGRHHLLLAGSPGCGKTFALRQFKHLLPPLSEEERMEVALIHGRAPAQVPERPYRSPHHSASGAALLGGSQLQPGEVTLAHHGVLFLDELAEFPRPALEALREPLDEKTISLSRARGRVELPAKFLLTAATNPCPCGFYFSRTEQCRCKVGSPQKYQQKLSGPLLERFDLLLLLDHLLDRGEMLSPSCASAPLSPLNQLAVAWMRDFLSDPQRWISHFIAVQSRAWQSGADSLSLQLSAEVASTAGRKAWSTRKSMRIQSLCQTLVQLFSLLPNRSSCPDTWIAIAEELRNLETALQSGVCVLTSFAGPQNLKKNSETHDTPECVMAPQGPRQTGEEDFSYGQNNSGGG
ncbi:MAG: hypothetical protein RIR26_1824 [Pseudomonadota bacterium]|jgi:magnesium chelatase family protein